jgi:hypothetical protein
MQSMRVVSRINRINAFLLYSHLMSRKISLLLTVPCALPARHKYWPWVVLEILCNTRVWLVMMMPLDAMSGSFCFMDKHGEKSQAIRFQLLQKGKHKMPSSTHSIVLHIL